MTAALRIRADGTDGGTKQLGKLRTDLVTYNNRILQLESAMRTPVPAPSPAPASSLARSLKLV